MSIPNDGEKDAHLGFRKKGKTISFGINFL